MVVIKSHQIVLILFIGISSPLFVKGKKWLILNGKIK